MEAVSTTRPNGITFQRIDISRDVIQVASVFCYTFDIVKGDFLRSSEYSYKSCHHKGDTVTLNSEGVMHI
jgi:hypothetical protein